MRSRVDDHRERNRDRRTVVEIEREGVLVNVVIPRIHDDPASAKIFRRELLDRYRRLELVADVDDANRWHRIRDELTIAHEPDVLKVVLAFRREAGDLEAMSWRGPQGHRASQVRSYEVSLRDEPFDDCRVILFATELGEHVGRRSELRVERGRDHDQGHPSDFQLVARNRVCEADRCRQRQQDRQGDHTGGVERRHLLPRARGWLTAR